MSGHGGFLATGMDYAGKLVVVDAANGAVLSNTEITAGGVAEIIYNECWGVAAVPDGAATPTADAAGGEVWTHVMSMSMKCQRNGMIDVSRGELDLRHHVPCFM